MAPRAQWCARIDATASLSMWGYMANIIQSSFSSAAAVELNRIVRLGEVTRLTGRSRASIYRDMARGRFPRQVSIGPRAVGWRFQDVAAHLEKIAAGGVS